MATKPARSKRTLVRHSFTLVLSGFDELTGEIEDGLFDAGCDDALLGIRNGVPFLDFDREAASRPEAVLSAIRDVARSRTGASVVRIEPDDLVSMSEIARRLARSRESVRQLWSGKRGPGGFPPPVSSLRSSSPLWSWAEVLDWIARSHIDGKVDAGTCRDARFTKLANEALRHLGANCKIETLQDAGVFEEDPVEGAVLVERIKELLLP